MEDLNFYKMNPSVIIEDTINKIDNKLSGVVTGDEPTSPFHMLIEASVALSGDNIIAAENIIRKKFPTLAVDEHDLFHHMSDDELANMFAIPGETSLAFYINVLDLKQFGYRKDGSKYVETVIPTNTKIIVKGTTFTLLNDIAIKLYDNGSVAAEQLNNTMDIAVNDIGILYASVISDKEGVEWITLETKVKNISKVEKLLPITPGKGLSTTIALTNKFTACYVSVIDNNGETPLSITYSEKYIDPLKPTAYVTLASDKVIVSIPDVYVLEKLIEGKLKISVYECNGKHYLPLNKFGSEDYTIEIGDDAKSPSAATSRNIAMLSNSRFILDNGVDGMSFEELRESIINNTTGDIDLPITEYQIKRKASMYNYTLFKVTNTLTSRTYIASKDLEVSDNKLILSSHDLFFNNVKVDLSIDKFKSGVVTHGESFTIKANTVFKYDNGIVTICDDSTLAYISSLSRIDRMEYLKNNRLFYTPYEYVILYEENITQSEIYYFKPYLENMRIITKNTNIEPNTNTYQYAIAKVEDGYEIYTNILSNDELSKTDMSKLKARIVLPLVDSNGLTVYFDANYDVENKVFKFFISSEFIANDKISIANGVSKLFNKEVAINTYANIYIYTTDSTVTDSSQFLQTELDNPNELDITVLTKESINIVFGEKIKYLYNNVYNTYSERKYKKYTEDIPLRYSSNVYAETVDGTIVDAETRTDGKVLLSATILHQAGDIVMDNGEIVYKHRKGDNILENGLPIVDEEAGILRYITILMLEYPFRLVESVPYKNYNDLTMDNINNIVINDMTTLNDLTMENTSILYKSSKSTDQVSVVINNVNYLLDYIVKPSVKLYVLNTATLTPDDVERFKDISGKIISKHLNKSDIVLRYIKDEIMSTLGSNISAVGIEGIDPNNSEIIKITGSNRFTLAKKLTLNKSNEFIVKYDLDFNIQYI